VPLTAPALAVPRSHDAASSAVNRQWVAASTTGSSKMRILGHADQGDARMPISVPGRCRSERASGPEG